MREVTNFPTRVTKVPYSIQPAGTKWNLCFGLFHSNRSGKWLGLASLQLLQQLLRFGFVGERHLTGSTLAPFPAIGCRFRV